MSTLDDLVKEIDSHAEAVGAPTEALKAAQIDGLKNKLKTGWSAGFKEADVDAMSALLEQSLKEQMKVQLRGLSDDELKTIRPAFDERITKTLRIRYEAKRVKPAKP